MEEVLQFFLIEDTICEEELEFLQGQLPVICSGQARKQLLPQREEHMVAPQPSTGTTASAGKLLAVRLRPTDW